MRNQHEDGLISELQWELATNERDIYLNAMHVVLRYFLMFTNQMYIMLLFNVLVLLLFYVTLKKIIFLVNLFLI